MSEMVSLGEHGFPRYGYGSELNHHRTAGFSPWFHLPGFQFGYLFLTHSHIQGPQIHVSPGLGSSASLPNLGSEATRKLNWAAPLQGRWDLGSVSRLETAIRFRPIKPTNGVMRYGLPCWPLSGLHGNQQATCLAFSAFTLDTNRFP